MQTPDTFFKNKHTQYILFSIENQGFCINVDEIQDVMDTPKMTRIPLCTSEIAGLLNLRGRIVTAMDMAVTLSLRTSHDPKKSAMAIIVDTESDLYSLLVDHVGEIISIAPGDIESKSNAVDPRWKNFAVGIYKYGDELIVILNTQKLLDMGEE